MTRFHTLTYTHSQHLAIFLTPLEAVAAHINHEKMLFERRQRAIEVYQEMRISKEVPPGRMLVHEGRETQGRWKRARFNDILLVAFDDSFLFVYYNISSTVHPHHIHAPIPSSNFQSIYSVFLSPPSSVNVRNSSPCASYSSLT